MAKDSIDMIMHRKVLVTNDDGYDSPGLHRLVDILRPWCDLTVVAPKRPQSGMSMAVTMGFKPIAVKHLLQQPGEDWWYVDGTPASCVKFGIDNVLHPDRPELLISGINHGSNAATASIYSGTIGAAMEGAVNGIPAVGLSIDSFNPDKGFSAVAGMLPDILERIIPVMERRFGLFYNINFPDYPLEEIKGIKTGRMGRAHWEREYRDYGEFLRESGFTPSEEDLRYVAAKEEGEQLYVMAGSDSRRGVRRPARQQPHPGPARRGSGGGVPLPGRGADGGGRRDAGPALSRRRGDGPDGRARQGREVAPQPARLQARNRFLAA